MFKKRELLIFAVSLVAAFMVFSVVNAAFTGPSLGPSSEDGVMSVSGTDLVVGGGSGKITAGTIDPLYTIDGDKYATYVAGMIGVQEEMVGTINSNGKTVVDFRNQEKGSDFWVFAKTTDLERTFQDLAVNLTPAFNGNVWYEKNYDTLELTIYADQAGEISFRLTAPRFDWQKWQTVIGSKEKANGLILNTGSDGKMKWPGQ